MKRALIVGSVSLASLMLGAGTVAAQSNPFAPQNGGGLTKAEVEQIARRAAEERAAAAATAPATPEQPGNPAAGLPAQPGIPAGMPVQVEEEPEDPVALLLSEEGSFVGCVRNVPIFRDKFGRRVYFTSKELKDSEAIRRFARC